MLKICIVYLLAMLLLSQGSYAAQADINFTSITAKEGLSSNTVYAIIKDKYGLMWYGTNNGLCKYDGTNFITYRHEPGKAYTLPDNDVLCLYEDRSGTLWIGTTAGGLSYYDRLKDRIVTYKGDGTWPEMNRISPRTITQDHSGRLWVGTYGDLRTIDLHNGKITRVTLPVSPGQFTDTFVIITLFEDSKNRMWVGTNNGLFCYDSIRKKTSFYKNDPNAPGSLSNNVVKSVTEDKKGGIWVATLGGLNHLLPGNTFSILRKRHDGRNSLSSDALFAMKTDTDGKIWIGTEDGVDVFDPLTSLFQVLKPDPRNVFSLKSPSVRSIYIDPSGIYWIGTFGGGLAKYDKTLLLFNLKQCNPFDNLGLGAPVINAFAELNNHSVFVGTDGAGVELFDLTSGYFKRVSIKTPLHQPDQPMTVLSLFIDHQSTLWVGTYHEGLFKISLPTGKTEQFVAGRRPGELNNNDITSLAEDDQGELWIGTVGGGVSVYDPVQHAFKTFEQKYKQKLPLNDFINSLVKSPKGDIWIASSGTGVAVFHPANRSTEQYDRKHSGLPSDEVKNLLFDSSGNLWLATDEGMCSLNERTKQLKTYTERDGLPNDMIKTIIEDKTGLLWISTIHGISSFDRLTGKFHNFEAENGLQPGDFSAGAGIRLSGGAILFGGGDGFNYFNPMSLAEKADPGPVLLTDLKVGNESVVPAKNGPIEDQIAIAKTINLKYGRNFSISYTALNYTTPLQNLFAYKLKGFEKEWNYVHKSRVANYTNIDPGTYTFEVKASMDGVHWSKPATIKVVIDPPFWRTSYAYLSYALLVMVILYTIRRKGIQKIKREYEIEREKLEFRQLIDRERHNAEQLHELDLMKIKFLTDLSHEFRTPISLIMAPVDKLLEKQLAGEDLEDLKMINRNAKRLLHMANQLLDFRKMEEQELSLNPEPGDIIAFVKETGDAFRDLAAKKQIKFITSAPSASWQAIFDHNKLERIIFNLLSNAFKFTPQNGTVTLSLEIVRLTGDKAHLVITVSDTGIGIPKDEINKVFDRFYQHQNSGILNQGTGIGLAITKEFVEMQGGTIYVESDLNLGSKFIVELDMTGAVNASTGYNDSLVTEPACDTELSAVTKGADNQKAEAAKIIANSNNKAVVVLAEDNDEFRAYLANHLSDYYHIVEAVNGKEGWQHTLTFHPQLVVSDINMPLMTGIELSKKIKDDKRTTHIPVILLTAMTGEDAQLQGLNSGANDYLSKPFNFQILNSRIRNLLDLNKKVKDTYSKQIQLQGHDIVTESANLKLLNSVLNYIEKKISDPDLSVEELSKHVGMSRGSLYYKLIELTGLTPIEYIRTVKLEKAAALMETSELNVTQISYMTGFGTPSYFTRMFKSKYGVVPSEYLTTKRAPVAPVLYPSDRIRQDESR